MVVTPSVPVKANSGVRARVPAAGKVLEGDDKPTLLREDVHYLHYITIITQPTISYSRYHLSEVRRLSRPTGNAECKTVLLT